MKELISFLERLRAAKISYSLTSVREAVMVSIAVPGERWEVEFFEDGEIEVEVFRSNGRIEGASAIERLFELHEDRA